MSVERLDTVVDMFKQMSNAQVNETVFKLEYLLIKLTTELDTKAQDYANPEE